MKIYFPKMISLFAFATMMTLSACGGGSGGNDDPDPEPDPEPVEDTTDPVIKDPTVPAAAGFGLGADFKYTGEFTDDTELKQVVFSLSDNKTTGAASLKAATGVDDDPWVVSDKTVSLSGTSKTVDESIFGTIPSSDIWTGDYTLTITCTDKAGNSVTKTINVPIN